MPTLFRAALILGLIAGVGCHDSDTSDPPADRQEDAETADSGAAQVDANDDASPHPEVCDAEADKTCLAIQRGESEVFRSLPAYETYEMDDRGTSRTVIRLADLVDEDTVEDPAGWRYQLFGTDGYTFGGYASWDQLLQAHLELGTRRVFWDPAVEAPHSWSVKDAYLMVLSPGGD